MLGFLGGGGSADFIFMGVGIFPILFSCRKLLQIAGNCWKQYHGVGKFYLINSKKLQIGIGIGKFSIINSEKLHIGNFWGTDP